MSRCKHLLILLSDIYFRIQIVDPGGRDCPPIQPLEPRGPRQIGIFIPRDEAHMVEHLLTSRRLRVQFPPSRLESEVERQLGREAYMAGLEPKDSQS